MSLADEPDPFLFTSEAVLLIDKAGVFGERFVELVEGKILRRVTKKPGRAMMIGIIVKLLNDYCDDSWHVRCHCPLELSEYSLPVPDISIVSGKIRDYIDHHPRAASLVLEIAESVLEFLRQTKSKLYSTAGVQEYWIVNLCDNQVEVYRQPTSNGYAEKFIAKAGEKLSPLVLPEAQIAVDDLLP